MTTSKTTAIKQIVPPPDPHEHIWRHAQWLAAVVQGNILGAPSAHCVLYCETCGAMVKARLQDIPDAYGEKHA